MIHMDTELRFISNEIGYGVFATRAIPRGTLVWVLDPLDRVLTTEQFRSLPEPLQPVVERYAYIDRNGNWIVCWDWGRYMNHSCLPSSRGITEAFEIAVRDIAAGDQLTCEYGSLNLDYGFQCKCGAEDCRGAIAPDDVLRLAPAWDREIAEAFALARTVPQPLLPFATVGARDAEVARVLASGGSVELPSIATSLFRESPQTMAATARR